MRRTGSALTNSRPEVKRAPPSPVRRSERATVQFRAEAFNVTNTPTFFLPNANNSALTIGNANFGKLVSSSATGRQIQFGLKVIF